MNGLNYCRLQFSQSANKQGEDQVEPNEHKRTIISTASR
jgi:hypothetical protein